MADIYDRVRTITVDQLDCDPDRVSPEATFDDLGADSLDQVELVMAFEEEFDVEISDDEAENARTVQDVVNLVTKALG
ncbi:acyl carrier protein [Bajunvirus bajun]|uniref:Acyl carrier protein n=1 Tax=Brevundimonas phage vB_BgoS-Bajun TaxID=2948594 RepID=A0A9E7N4N8_9CAUD|nr:acyl carrier protein [Brevundimonas phage vB_BgoS-Bajun]